MSWVESSKIQHPDDVRKALGFNGEPDGFDLLKLYDRAIQMGDPFSRGDLRVAWKVANDPYYWAAFKRYNNLKTIVKAGFFDDGQEPGIVQERADIQFLTTPLEIVRQRVIELEEQGKIHDKPLVVALTTGCFAPIHSGHVAMMEKAKTALEGKGYEVLGGYMSPSHDDYVSTKGKVARRLTAAHRTLLVNKVIDGSNWLSVDPWESRYAPTDINFTDTIQRLENYINAHINTSVPIQIAYVFGADNVQFARTFVDKGLGVCVPRPGNDTGLNELIEQSGLKDNPHFVLANSSELKLSSTEVRSGDAPSAEQLEQDVTYQDLLKGEARMSSEENVNETYLMRDDLNWATQHWKSKVRPQALNIAIDNFRDGLVRAIENAFERSRAPGYPNNVEVVLLSVEDQISEADKIMEVAPEWIINNDVITGGDNTSIGLSRLFELSSPQLYSEKLIPRPGQQDLKRVIGRLPKGKYTIVDDDIATGSTIRMIEEQLPEEVSFKDRIALSELAFKRVHPEREYSFWDIVDARDFLMGAKSSGLVVQLFNGAVGRAPYMLPYTSLVSRAKIPPDQEMSFTEEILNLNKRFLRDIWVDLKLQDTDPQFRALMGSIGFRDQMHMNEINAWHKAHIHS